MWTLLIALYVLMVTGNYVHFIVYSEKCIEIDNESYWCILIYTFTVRNLRDVKTTNGFLVDIEVKKSIK